MKRLKYQWQWLFNIAVLAASLLGVVYCWFTDRLGLLLASVIFTICWIIYMYRIIIAVWREIDHFAESVQYRDFSRNYNVKGTTGLLQPLVAGFNQVNQVLKDINAEKETQNQYLEKIVSLIDTGVIAYETVSGKIVWMNEFFKEILLVPQFKTVDFLLTRKFDVFEAITGVAVGRHKVVQVIIDKLPVKLWVSAAVFVTNGIEYRLVAIKNVEDVVDETEAKAWQKLLSVMTHEIMNSIAPISSLADTIKKRLAQIDISAEQAGLKEDLEIGIETIRSRSEGLLKFAKTYRSLNKITQPNLEWVYIRDLFERILQLMGPMFEQKKIEPDVILKSTDLRIHIDTYLIEQVLINLITNAMDALKERLQEKKIILSAAQKEKKIILKIADNGAGIPEDIIETIFVPFFSTKKGGSGIGLSLCRQIMLLHKGLITVQSRAGEGTVFILQLPVE